MALRVEQVRLAEVAAQGTRAVPGGTASAADFGGAVGDQLVAAGNRLEQSAERLHTLAVRTATENNEAAAKQADTDFNTQIRNTLFDPEKGYFTLKGKEALDQYKPTEAALRKLQQEHAGKLTNPEVRKLFGEVATRRLDAAFDSMAKHSATERRQWIDTVSTARAMNAGDDAIAYAEDDAKREAALNVGRQEIINNSRDLNEDPEITNRKLREYDSKAYKGVVERMIAADPMRAQAFYDANKHRIDGQQQIGLERTLKEATGRRRAEDDVNGVMAKPGDVNATSLHSAIVGHESGGRQVDDKGKTLTSSKGALGAGQIMPDTFKRFAKPGEKIDNKEDNLAVSKRMIDQYMRDYNGDWQRVAVAYFSGEGNVAPMASAKPYKVNSSDGHNTVEQYVANVGKNLGKSPLAPADAKPAKTYTDPREAAREIEANFAGYVEDMKRIYGNDPERLDKGLAVLRQRKAILEEGFAAQQKVNGEKALQFAMTPGASGTKPTSIDAIPPDLWTSLSADQQRSISIVLDNNLKNQDWQPNPKLYAELARQAVEDPEAFKKRDLVELAGQLPDADWKRFQNLQMEFGRRENSEEEKRASFAKALRVSDASLRSAAIYLGFSDSKGRVTKAKEFNDFKDQYQTALIKEMERYQAENKKRPSDEELIKMADRLLIQGRIRDTGMFSDDKTVFFRRREESGGADFYVPYDTIPKADRDAIERQMEARGMLSSSSSGRQKKKAVEEFYSTVTRGSK